MVTTFQFMKSRYRSTRHGNSPVEDDIYGGEGPLYNNLTEGICPTCNRPWPLKPSTQSVSSVKVPQPSLSKTIRESHKFSHRRLWSSQELKALVEGMYVYGNRWASIKKDGKFRDVLKDRSVVDLKDKARNERKKLERRNEGPGIFRWASAAGGDGAKKYREQ